MAVLDEFGAEFVRLKHEKCRTTAWSDLQDKLMSNLGLLTTVSALKDLLSLSMDMEKHIKGESTVTAKDPLEVLREYLNEEAVLPVVGKVQ